MDRREFFKLSAQSAILLGLSPWLVRRAQAAEAPWFFVQIQHVGGWDVTLGTDPWLAAKPDPKEMFIEYDPSNIERIAGLGFGPALTAMKPFAADMAVVNGIFMSPSDNGHDAAEKYILSGTTNQQWGLLPVEILENRPSQFLGILNNAGVYSGSRSPTLTALSSVQSLAASSSDGSPFESTENAGNLLSQIQGEISNAAGQIQILKDILAGYGAPQLQDAHYLAAAFASGFSQVASYRIFDGNLDTHSNHVGAHLQIQAQNWNKIAELLAVFKKTQLGNTGVSLFERTTFFITSEFARTAALNSAQGKDHNPLTNSVVLIGPAIKGGTLIGGSHLVTTAQSKTGSSYHVASPIDPATGQALNARAQGAMILRPENVAATVIESLGISRRRFASVPAKVPSLTALLRK